MAIQFVGGKSTNAVGSGTANTVVAINSGLTGGIASAAAIGDLVVAVYATGSTADRTLSITGASVEYTLIGSELYSDDTYDTNLRVAYKYLTAADTSVVFGPTGSVSDAGAMAVLVFRNVDSTTPIDVAATTATGGNTGRPDPPSITPTTSGAIIVVTGGGAAATGANYTASYLSGFQTNTGADTNDAMVGAGYVTWTSGAYNPAAWTGGTTGTTDSWAAVTFALRPAIRASSGTLTGQGSTISGSASRTTPAVTHDTTGTLTGQGSSTTGSATRYRAFATTGTLTGDIGSISGTAARYRAFATSGALSGQGTALDGSATRYRQFATSGTLAGQGSSITGDANRFRELSTSGTLTGQGSTVTGDADREAQAIPHTSEGALTGQGSVITGDADRESQAIPHVADGVLTGQGSTISGDATRYRQFASTGQLTGQDSAVAGTSVRYREFTATGVLVADESIVTGDATRSTAGEHVTSGDLQGQGSVITGSAELTKGKVTVVEGGIARKQRKQRLIIVEVDGKEYRLTEAQLPSFLEQVRVEAQQRAKVQEKPVKRGRRAKQAKLEATYVEEAPVIVVKQAPIDIVPKINAQINKTNTVIANIFAVSVQRYMQELEDEEIILMLM